MTDWEPGTAEDLIADAHKSGHTATSRMLTDWVQRGLLDKPVRRGAGRGKGTTKGLYPATQRQLFSILLDKRGTHPSVAHLSAVPVGIWVYWGEEWIPYRQARRALHTWVERYRQSSHNRSTRNTEAILKQLDHPQATDTARTKLRRLLNQTLTSGRVTNPEDLTSAISAVFDPHHQGRILGVPGAHVSPTTIVGAALCRARALDALHTDTITKTQLDTARADLTQSRNDYLRNQPALALAATDGPTQALFDTPVWDNWIQESCYDLLLVLGHHLDPGRPS